MHLVSGLWERRRRRRFDPRGHGRCQRLARLPHEPFGVGRVRPPQGPATLLKHSLSSTLVDDCRRQEPERVVAMHDVVPGEEAPEKGPSVLPRHCPHLSAAIARSTSRPLPRLAPASRS